MIKKTDDEQIDEILEAVYNRGRIMEMDFNRSGKAPQWRSDEYAKQQLLALIEERERMARLTELKFYHKQMTNGNFNYSDAVSSMKTDIEALQKGKS